MQPTPGRRWQAGTSRPARISATLSLRGGAGRCSGRSVFRTAFSVWQRSHLTNFGHARVGRRASLRLVSLYNQPAPAGTSVPQTRQVPG